MRGHMDDSFGSERRTEVVDDNSGYSPIADELLRRGECRRGSMSCHWLITTIGPRLAGGCGAESNLQAGALHKPPASLLRPLRSPLYQRQSFSQIGGEPYRHARNVLSVPVIRIFVGVCERVIEGPIRLPADPHEGH